ncbi:Bax inhibitor-1/YccA family protein [Candidatus Phytoplasma asiaticum]|uniref:Bax inhibitor-1/YccA family protein n=1 Tax=Candidatus Phytoplasma asiaticum TaxID=2763338 RepID=A0AAX3B9V9_9MOLU|nr:Bax inhibitor-1/YccA family protein ['Parthenium hysterophorus' phyllody phytoplasma]UQV27178.1 Bax inhibitor-1/YccA family protein ['Parthenium hysterophorus' phyllody phytoplasma]
MIRRDKNFILTNIINVSKTQMKNNYFTSDYSTRLGIVIKTLFLLMISLFSGLSYFYFLSIFSVPIQLSVSFLSISILSFFGIILGLAFYSGFVKYNSLKKVSILSALFQGMFMGSFFRLVNINYSGLLFILAFALMCVCVLFVFMNLLYSLGVVKVNYKLKFFLIILTILLMFFVSINAFINNSFLGFLISIVSILIGSLELSRNFAAVECLIKKRLDKQYEWALAFSFHIILIHLFLDFVVLLLRFINSLRK